MKQRAVVRQEETDSSEAGKRELRISLLVTAILTLVALASGDSLSPFFSLTFVSGTALIFFFSVTFGSRHGLAMACGLLTIILWASVTGDGDGLQSFLMRSPFITLFFVSLAIVPNIRPYVLIEELRSFKGQVRRLEEKVVELQAVLREEQRVNVEEKSLQSRQQVAKLSSRNTIVSAYARGLLQASSSREILNLLFYNLTKTFMAGQTAMLLLTSDGNELIISRIVHPHHERLENTRISAETPLLGQVLVKKTSLASPNPTPISTEIDTEYLIPIIVDDKVIAIFSLAEPKEGKLSNDDRAFIDTLASLTAGAMAQLNVTLS